MIDLHTHVVPYVDDGAKDIEMSLKMLAIAEADGIMILAATPHFIQGSWAPQGPAVRAAVDDLNERARAEGLKIAVTAAHEVRAAAGLVPKIRSGEILAYDARRRYVLLEMPGANVPSWMDQLVFELEVGDIVPVIAHPERNVGVSKDPMLLYNLVQRGCKVQVTAASLLGRFGQTAQATSMLLLEHRLVHVIASDAHDADHRTPTLSPAWDAVVKLSGESSARELFVTNPRHILEGAEFDSPEPEPILEEEQASLMSIFRKMLERI